MPKNSVKKIKIFYYDMSFASYAPTVTIDFYTLNRGNIASDEIETVFSKLLSKGTYFISFCPMVTTDGDFTSITAEIGSQLGGLEESIVCNWFGTPYNYHNMGDEQITMSGVYVSNGDDNLMINITANSSEDWNMTTNGPTAYNLGIMKLT